MNEKDETRKPGSLTDDLLVEERANVKTIRFIKI